MIKDIDEQLYETGEKLIYMMEQNKILEKWLRKAIKDINEILKDEDNTTCKHCLWEKDCQTRRQGPCSEFAEWRHSAKVLKLLDGEEDE